MIAFATSSSKVSCDRSGVGSVTGCPVFFRPIREGRGECCRKSLLVGKLGRYGGPGTPQMRHRGMWDVRLKARIGRNAPEGLTSVVFPAGLRHSLTEQATDRRGSCGGFIPPRRYPLTLPASFAPLPHALQPILCLSAPCAIGWMTLAFGMQAANGGPLAENPVFGHRNSSMAVRIEQMLPPGSRADVSADLRARFRPWVVDLEIPAHLRRLRSIPARGGRHGRQRRWLRERIAGGDVSRCPRLRGLLPRGLLLCRPLGRLLGLPW